MQSYSVSGVQWPEAIAGGDDLLKTSQMRPAAGAKERCGDERIGLNSKLRRSGIFAKM